jgi:hypothetical protein
MVGFQEKLVSSRHGSSSCYNSFTPRSLSRFPVTMKVLFCEVQSKYMRVLCCVVL